MDSFKITHYAMLKEKRKRRGVQWPKVRALCGVKRKEKGAKHAQTHPCGVSVGNHPWHFRIHDLLVIEVLGRVVEVVAQIGRGVAKLGKATRRWLGRRGFESRHPDHNHPRRDVLRIRSVSSL